MQTLIRSQPAHAEMSDGVFKLEYGSADVHYVSQPETDTSQVDDGTFAQDALDKALEKRTIHDRNVYKEGNFRLNEPSHPTRKPKTKH